MKLKTMNAAERCALAKLFNRDRAPLSRTEWMRQYRAFRKTAWYSFAGCWVVQWCGMTIGIESDGYTHS